MKIHISTVAVLALIFGIATTSAQPDAKLELLKVSGFDGVKSVERTWTAPAARLEQASIWKDEKKPPPLTVSDAVRIARTYLQSIGQPSKLPIQCVRLKKPPRHEEKGMYFFFVVSFDDWDEKHPTPLGVDVVVLLDGSVVAPNEPAK